ncbi:hypothetical protein JCM19037_1433 [Geomicrobium sp. JCM 19037]|nr:hypothetical protein JCM19037_1433 [Geomicrobium sp. JCM 19037]
MMRKAVIGISVAVILGIAAFIGLYYSLSDMTRANINPFIQEEYWYVQVDEDGIVAEDEQGTVYYELPAMNEDGDEMDIEFTALSELREGAFIQLTMKEGFVMTYEEVGEEDVP